MSKFVAAALAAARTFHAAGHAAVGAPAHPVAHGIGNKSIRRHRAWIFARPAAPRQFSGWTDGIARLHRPLAARAKA